MENWRWPLDFSSNGGKQDNSLLHTQIEKRLKLPITFFSFEEEKQYVLNFVLSFKTNYLYLITLWDVGLLTYCASLRMLASFFFVFSFIYVILVDPLGLNNPIIRVQQLNMIIFISKKSVSSCTP